MMLDSGFVVLLCSAVAVGGFFAVGPRLLFRWYLREISRLEIPQDRREAIATYPFA